VIKGAKEYLGATVAKGDIALDALGYSFEKLVLYATSIGLGTCWLGGTFKRANFANAMEVKEDELFPIISPLGYPIEKKRFMDSMVRRIAKSDQRKSWEHLFFVNDFTHPMTKEEAGEFAYPLEMVRLAPSASNKQPWRIVKSGQTYHFYKEKGYSVKMAYDIQEVDMGIAACHFHLAALEKGLIGEFKRLPTPSIAIPKDVDYRFSYVR
jgi:nitroreductase